MAGLQEETCLRGRRCSRIGGSGNSSTACEEKGNAETGSVRASSSTSNPLQENNLTYLKIPQNWKGQL